MIAISALLHFLAHHPFLSLQLLVLAGLALGAAIAHRRRNAAWYALGIVGLVLGMLNVFTGSMANAVFLNAFGTYGTAVVTHAEETSSQLNERNIWAYDAVMQTAEGRDVKVHFDTLSASLYPVRNRIDLPPVGERFVVKYIPGYERNIAIMRDESPFGKRILLAQARGPVERAAAQLAASPDNEAFKQEYRLALQDFLARHGQDAAPEVAERYRKALQALEQSGPQRAP